MAGMIAVIGHGYWGKNLVRNFYELGSLHTVCDANPALELEIQSKYPGVRFRSDFAGVLEDQEIAGAVLATPAISHFDLAMAALRAGKDVFVEKPLA